jgi:hypothetical protein
LPLFKAIELTGSLQVLLRPCRHLLCNSKSFWIFPGCTSRVSEVSSL